MKFFAPPLVPPVQGPLIKEPEAKPHIVYDVATGRIFQTGTIAREHIQLAPGRAVIEGAASLERHYVRDGIVLLRAPLRVQAEGRTLKGLPEGSLLLPVGLPALTAGGDWTAPAEMGPSVTIMVDHPAHIPQSFELRDYRADRRDLYPDIGEQLDALWKGLRAAQEAGVDMPAETAAALAKIQAVKAAIPKD